MEICGKEMRDGKTCGRKAGHKRKEHKSVEAYQRELAKKREWGYNHPEKNTCNCVEHTGNESWHGDIAASGYKHHRCRCDKCRAAATADAKQYRARPEIRDRVNEQQRERCATDPEFVKRRHAQEKAWRERMTPEQKAVRGQQKRTTSLRTGQAWASIGIIGMNAEHYDELLTLQNGCCAICGRHATEFKKRLHVDHDHSITDRYNVRGLLCVRCNNALGWIDSGVTVPGPDGIGPQISAYLERAKQLRLEHASLSVAS